MEARMSATKKPRYYTPTVSVDVSLDEFSTEQLRKELQHRAGEVPQDLNDDFESIEGLRRIRTLLLCGQKDAALAAMSELCRDVLGTAL
jgi:hypothetical protein